MINNEFRDILSFYQRGSCYDIIQARTGEVWEQPWTFAPCSNHAAEKAAWMLHRIYKGKLYDVRHIRRARLKVQQAAPIEVVVMTVIPTCHQIVLSLETEAPVQVGAYLTDAPLKSLEEAFRRT